MHYDFENMIDTIHGKIGVLAQIAMEERMKVDVAIRGPAKATHLPSALSFTNVPADIRHFTGREAELQDIGLFLDEYSYPSSPNITVLSGIGGIGKSSLAIAFANCRNDYDLKFWVRAQSLSIICADLSAIARGLEIKQQDGSQTSADQDRFLFFHWLGATGL